MIRTIIMIIIIIIMTMILIELEKTNIYCSFEQDQGTEKI